MARNKIGLQFDGWEETMAKLDEIGGTGAVRQAVENALIESKEYVNPLIEKAMNKLPAKGKYSTGGTKRSIDDEKSIQWEGMTGETKIGFKFDESGTKSIFLMYGTPKMPPVKGLKSAIYGSATKKKVAEIQADEVNKVIKKIMEG